MNSKVLSYKLIMPKEGYGEYLGYGNGFITEKDTLKVWFPDILSEEQAKSECNYFAMYFPHTSSSLTVYWILSQEAILYEIKPGYAMCIANDDIVNHVMLVCDDEVGTLKNSIDINSIKNYTDENWDCRYEDKYEEVFF